ncbi:MAG: cell division protein FtsQ/DivIB [Saccharospirillum sp.]|nr:cell division protein FtsQ/DivIB [Saccharospirillum sp.]
MSARQRKAPRRGATKRRQPLDWRTPLKRAVVLVAGVTMMIGLLLGGHWLWQQGWHQDMQPWMPLAEWDLESPLIYQDRDRVAAVMAPYLGQSLLTLSPAEMKQQLEALPWIDQARVDKAWPNQVRIRLVEHEPVARWNGEQVLNSMGEALDRPVAELDLADLSGPNGQARRVMEQYLLFSRIFVGSGFRLDGVDMHPRGAWDLKLNNGIEVVLGSRDMLERTRRVVALLERAELDLDSIEYIDARYPNGLAVGYREITEPSA